MVNRCHRSPRDELLNGLHNKMELIVEKVMGSEEQRRATAVKRLDIRESSASKPCVKSR